MKQRNNYSALFKGKLKQRKLWTAVSPSQLMMHLILCYFVLLVKQPCAWHAPEILNIALPVKVMPPKHY
jgi:hypothetical protein